MAPLAAAGSAALGAEAVSTEKNRGGLEPTQWYPSPPLLPLLPSSHPPLPRQLVAVVGALLMLLLRHHCLLRLWRRSKLQKLLLRLRPKRHWWGSGTMTSHRLSRWGMKSW
jgi:hypothetical protein